MPTTTWSSALDDINAELGLVSFSTTTTLTTSAAVVSTDLSALYPVDDTFEGWFWQARGGSNNGNAVRVVTAYTGSSGTLTVAGANLAAESANIACTLTRFHPSQVLRAFNRARKQVFPSIAIVRDIETMATGQRQFTFTLPSSLRQKPLEIWLGRRLYASTLAENLFTDGGMENWTSATALNSWTNTNHTSINRESQSTNPKNYAVLAGQYSARCVVQASAVNTLLQTVTPTVAAESMELNVGVWVYCKTASRVSASANGTLGSTHSGIGWEHLRSSATLGTAATNFVGGTSVTSDTGTFSYYVDEAIATLGQSELVDAPWDILDGWEWLPPAAGASTGGTLRFPYALPELRPFRIVARDLVSSVSALTDTIEIDGELLEPVYDYTRHYLCQEAAQTGPTDERNYWSERSSYYLARAEGRLGNRAIMQLPNRRIPMPT